MKSIEDFKTSLKKPLESPGLKNCYCPNPLPSDDGKTCKYCGGKDPIITKKPKKEKNETQN